MLDGQLRHSRHNEDDDQSLAQQLICLRMGGPKAWKEMQQRQKEFQNGWDAEPQQELDSEDEDGKYVEKRDLYAEYDVDAETANEKEARGGNSPLEDEGAEDVNLSHRNPRIEFLICHRNSQCR
jgi:hypothetical protein